MNNFLRMCLNIITQIGPYLVVLLLLKYLVNLQLKEWKKKFCVQSSCSSLVTHISAKSIVPDTFLTGDRQRSKHQVCT